MDIVYIVFDENATIVAVFDSAEAADEFINRPENENYCFMPHAVRGAEGVDTEIEEPDVDDSFPLELEYNDSGEESFDDIDKAFL